MAQMLANAEAAFASALPVDYSKIRKLRRIELWPQHLYRGTVTLVAGPSGTGKGLIGVHATAVTARGGLFPGEDEHTTRDRTPASVLGVWLEDDPNEDLAWRLDAALDGEGLSKEEKARVFDVTESPEGDPFDMSEEAVNRLRTTIELLGQCDGQWPRCGCGRLHEVPHYPVRLVIVDNLNATGAPIGSNRQARKALRPLMKMTKETGVATLVLHHTIKDGVTVAGSSGLVEVPRLVFMVRPEEDEVLLSATKSNNLGHIADLRYEITGNEDSPYLRWIEEPEDGTAEGPEWQREAQPPDREVGTHWHTEPAAMPQPEPPARSRGYDLPAWRS